MILRLAFVNIVDVEIQIDSVFKCVDSSWNKRSKHLLLLSIVPSSICKKSFIQLHRLKVLFRLLLIIWFYSKPQNIFSLMTDLKKCVN